MARHAPDNIEEGECRHPTNNLDDWHGGNQRPRILSLRAGQGAPAIELVHSDAILGRRLRRRRAGLARSVSAPPGSLWALLRSRLHRARRRRQTRGQAMAQDGTTSAHSVNADAPARLPSTHYLAGVLHRARSHSRRRRATDALTRPERSDLPPCQRSTLCLRSPASRGHSGSRRPSSLETACLRSSNRSSHCPVPSRSSTCTR